MSEQASEERLKPCPFCSGVASWCKDVGEEKHDCHYIVCTGCGLSCEFTDGNGETLEAERQWAARKWNNRV